jgi:hypothetical protein
MTTKVAYRGVPFENGVEENGEDKILIIPPLPLNKVRQSFQEVSDITNSDPVQETHLRNERVKNVIHDAIKRNYPDFSREELEEFLTYKNLQAAYQSAIGSSTSPDGRILPDPVRSVGEIRPESPIL